MSICTECFHSYVCEKFNEHRECDNKRCYFANDHFVSADLINRQQAEIEEYKKHIDNDIIYVDAVRAEAVKEFAERLKTKVDGWYYDFAKFDDTMDALMEIANLVKEFTEGDNTDGG